MRLMKIAVAAALPVATLTAVVPVAHAAFVHAPTSAAFLPAPTYTSTLLGPGLASMYPVDVTQNASYYFVLDAGRYRVVAVNRSTGAISCQVGGHQGSGPGQFGDARALDFDTATNQLYVADTPNNRVEIFSFSASACAAGSSTGLTFVSQFGSKGAGNEQFSQVYGIAVDAVNGWVYAVDGAGRVEKSNLAGTYISQFNAGGTLNEPRQVTVAPNSDVLVMNARNHECDVFSDTGKLLFTFGSQGTGNGQFTDDPRGVSVSQNGNLVFVTDSGGKRVEVFTLTSNGTNYTSAAFAYTIPSGTSAGKFTGPRGLTTTADGHLVLTDEWGFGLHEFTFTATGATATRNLFETAPPVPGVDSPRGVQVAANGQIYIVDYWNQRIEYLNANGTGAASFGFRGNPSQKGAINFAWSAAIQPGTGDIFVANRESNQVEIFSPTGASLLIFGTKGIGNGQFHFPQGIAFDPTNGTLLVDELGQQPNRAFHHVGRRHERNMDRDLRQERRGIVHRRCRCAQPADRHRGRAGRHHLGCRHARQPRPEPVHERRLDRVRQNGGEHRTEKLPRALGSHRRPGRQHLGRRHRQQPDRLDGHVGQSHLQRHGREHGSPRSTHELGDHAVRDRVQRDDGVRQ